MRLSPNFLLDEFISKDGVYPDDVQLSNLYRLTDALEVVRSKIGVPISINSGFRSQAHNESIGGVKDSQHTKGKAADLRTSLSPLDLYNIIDDLMQKGLIPVGGLGLYDTFVHYDIRGVHARWDNRTVKKKVGWI
tara:strand:+ start:30563 stop:30967 length:405 start_codon:yes stop_codon:yes gene_type:complete